MHDTIKEPARETPVIREPDVLVVGGGAAGIAAAIAAARCGASTLLIERYGFLGGTLTNVTLGTLCGAYLVRKDSHTEIVGGIYAELVNRLHSRGAALEPRRWLNNVSTPYDPTALRLEADTMAKMAGVELLLHTTVVDAQTREGRVSAVIVESKAGRAAIRPRIIIDASGDADVAARAGAKFKVGLNGETQFPSTMIRFAGVDIAQFLEIPRARRLEMLEKAAADGYDLPRTSAGLQIHPIESVVHANVTRIRKADGRTHDLLDPWALTEAEIEGRRQAYLYEEVLRRYMPGFENARIVDIGAHLGIRETRLVEGDYELTENDVRHGSKPADSVAYCAWPMEIHGADRGTAWDWLPEGNWYGIPYRCLTVSGFDNLLVAGRNLSATHAAQSSARVAATCMAMGQAAGIAATFALSAAGNTRNIDVQRLCEQLKSDGVMLPPY